MQRILQFAKGVLIGVAAVVPGVSGGTMMVVLNIYDEVLCSISWKNYKRYLPFLILLGTGIVVGVVLFSHIMTVLLDHYRTPVYFSFIGLVLGSLPTIGRRAHPASAKPRNLLLFLAALGFMASIFSMGGTPAQGWPSDTILSTPLYFQIYLIITTAIATFAMILPGGGGSILMILMGVYEIVLNAIANFDVILLIPIGIGALVGGYTGLKLLKFLLRRYPQDLYFAILGLILGSLIAIFPGLPQGLSGVFNVLLLAFFAVATYVLSRRESVD